MARAEPPRLARPLMPYQWHTHAGATSREATHIDSSCWDFFLSEFEPRSTKLFIKNDPGISPEPGIIKTAAQAWLY